MSIENVNNKTEISRKHFYDEGERIKLEDRNAIYEISAPKELALDVDFGYVRYDTLLKLVDKYCAQQGLYHLDLGCGLGYLMAKMAQKGFKTSGVDMSRSFLDIAVEKLRHWNLSFEAVVEADLQKDFNLTRATYDVITSTDVLEHVEKPELFLKQIYELLSKDGKVFITTNNFLSIWGIEKLIKEKIMLKDGFHPIDKWYSVFSFKRIVRRYGFRVVEARGTYFLPLSRFRHIFSIIGIFKKRYEINEWLSKSMFKYFARDIILVLEKL